MLTQQVIGEHIDLDQSSVSRLLADLGIDWTTATLEAIRIAYIRRLREQAAGRTSSGELQLAGERARLASEQADRVAMINAVRRRELAPTAVLEMILSRVGRQIAGILDLLPIQLRRQSTSLTPDDLALIESEIIRARNLAANMELKFDEDVDGLAGDPAGDPLRAEAA